jgi:hypothetical protein
MPDLGVTRDARKDFRRHGGWRRTVAALRHPAAAHENVRNRLISFALVNLASRRI